MEAKLTEIFNAQYKLTTREVIEKKTRTERRTGHYTDENGNVHSYTYTVEVEYDWHVLVTTLTNSTMDSVVRNMGLTEDQMSRYELLLETRRLISLRVILIPIPIRAIIRTMIFHRKLLQIPNSPI